VPGLEGAPAPAGPAQPFTVGGASAAAPISSPGAPTALDRLRAGELSLDGYIESRVDEATAHLVGSLPPGGVAPAALESIRSALRDRITSDPLFVELVQTATGQTPEPRDD
jgi:hypothetical protein